VFTLGGDGLLLYANALFQTVSPPPIVPFSAGSMGFLAPFSPTDGDLATRLRRLLGARKSAGQDDGAAEPPRDTPPPGGLPGPLVAAAPDDDDDGGAATRLAETEEDDVVAETPPSGDNSMIAAAPGVVSRHGVLRDDRTASSFADDTPAPWPVSLRMRLRCCVVARENATVVARHETLNEVVIDRGSSSYLSAVDCFCNDQHLTTVQADGLIVATPTGSTAYSLAAGGPMLHPSSPSIVLVPICPHSLSFRPIVFPDSATLKFQIQPDARADAWVTFDGRKRVRMRHGDALQVTASPHPLPTLLRFGNTADWFDGLHSAFNFNTRPRQKPLI